jgi:hypothetical protein
LFQDGFFFDRVDDGCFQRDYGRIIAKNVSNALPAARERLVQEVQAAIGADRLIVANHMFDLSNVSGAMNEGWSVGHGPNGASAIWKNLARCDSNNKVVEAHLSGNVNNDSVAAFLIGAGELALFGSGGWDFKGDVKQIASRWHAEFFEMPLGLPLGPAQAFKDDSGNITMVRRFQSGTTARFCLNTSRGEVEWAKSSSE